MTAHLYRLPEAALSGRAAGDLLTLDGPEGHHAATVKRARVGQELLLSDGSGLLARAVVETLGVGELGLRVVDVSGAPGRSGPRFVLVQALAKGGRDEQAVETATEYGVDEILPWQARRCVVVWRGERGEKSRRKWESVAAAAAKQSRRPTVPPVADVVDTRALLDRVGRAALTLVLHEDAGAALAGHDLPADGDVLLVVGPEGGIDPDELAALAGAGATPVRLGPTVLRSSSAGPAALAVLSAAHRWR